MSAFEGFLTGFLGRTADVIKERKDKAENYFDQAIERARTVGADNLRQRTDNYQAMLSVANNLIQQAGMPEDLVRAIANEGPQALQEAYEVYATTADAIANGAEIELNEDFWRGAYDFASEVTQGSNMTLEDFFRQVNGLYGSNLAATTREGGDPFGAFVASGLGLNAMERAQDRLGEYDMGGGYSAADLIAMDARPSTTRPMGDTGFGGLDRAYIAEQTRTSQPMFDLETIERMSRTFIEQVAEEEKRLFQEYMSGVDPEGGGIDENITESSFKDEASRSIAERWAVSMGIPLSELSRHLPFLAPFYFPEEEEVVEEQVGVPGEVITTEPIPEEPVTTEDLQEAGIGDDPQVTPTEVVTEVTTPTVEPPSPTTGFTVTSNGRTVVFSEVLPTGEWVFKFSDNGDTITVTPEQFQEELDSGNIATIDLGLNNMPEVELPLPSREDITWPSTTPNLGGLGY